MNLQINNYINYFAFYNKYNNIIFYIIKFLTYQKLNYCDYTCNIATDILNKPQNYLCKKQCNAAEEPSDKNKTYINCYEPKDNDNSIYPVCESQFDSNIDFYKQSRCKMDMCNLCCASFDYISKTKISRFGLNNCYKGCLNKFDKSDNKNKK